MPLPERAGPAPGRLDASAVAPFVDAMAAHEVRCLAGLEAGALADLLALAPPVRRPVLRLDLAARRPALLRAEGVLQ